MPLINASAFEARTKEICREISAITYSPYMMDCGRRMGKGYKYASNAAFGMAACFFRKKSMGMDARNPLSMRIFHETEKICAKAIEREFMEKESRSCSGAMRRQAYEEIDRWLSENTENVRREYAAGAQYALRA